MNGKRNSSASRGAITLPPAPYVAETVTRGAKAGSGMAETICGCDRPGAAMHQTVAAEARLERRDGGGADWIVEWTRPVHAG